MLYSCTHKATVGIRLRN